MTRGAASRGPLEALVLPGTLLDGTSLRAMLDLVEQATGVASRIVRLGVAARFIDEAERVAALVAACDGPPLLVGHSLGGIVALEIAARHPSRVAAVVAIASNARGDGANGAARRAEQRRWAAERGVASLVRDRLAIDYALSAADAALIEALVGEAARTAADAFEHQLAYAAERPGLLAPRRPLGLPVLALSGRHDALCPPADGAAVAALGRPPSRHRTQADAGHLLPAQRPAWVAHAIARFVEALPAVLSGRPSAASAASVTDPSAMRERVPSDQPREISS